MSTDFSIRLIRATKTIYPTRSFQEFLIISQKVPLIACHGDRSTRRAQECL
jgi:hypothetical protein